MAGSEFRGGPRRGGGLVPFRILVFRAPDITHTHGGFRVCVFLSLFPKVMGSTGTSTPAVGPSSGHRFLTLRSIFLVSTQRHGWPKDFHPQTPDWPRFLSSLGFATGIEHSRPRPIRIQTGIISPLVLSVAKANSIFKSDQMMLKTDKKEKKIFSL